jgi:hypothetical protein
MLVTNFSGWYVELKEGSVNQLALGGQTAYVKNDLFLDLVALQDFGNVSMKRNTDNLTVSFDSFLNSSKDYDTLLENYESVIEGNYSDQINWNLTLEDVAYGFIIPEYGVHTNRVGNIFYIYTEDYTKLRSVNVTVQEHTSKNYKKEETYNDRGTPTVEFYVKLLDESGSVLEHQKRVVDPTGGNDPASFRFHPADRLEIYLGNTGGKDGVLYFDFDLIPGKVEQIELTYHAIQSTISVNHNTTVVINPHVTGSTVVSSLGLKG